MIDQPPGMPAWAQKIDDHGKRWWNKEKPVKIRRSEYITSIIFNLIWLYIINKVPDWNLKFINDHYMSVLWAMNMNVYVQVGGNLVMLVFGFRFIRYLAGILLESANFLVLIILYYIYPFDFSHVAGWTFMDQIIPWLLIIGMIVSALKVIGNTWNLIFHRG
jgi:hypothetical protein